MRPRCHAFLLDIHYSAHPRVDAALEFVHPVGKPRDRDGIIGAMIPGDTMQASASTNGTVPAGPPTPLSGGTNPPPNEVTSVNVWSSPPAFVTRTICPAEIEIYPGAKCHAGCPIMFAASGENTSPFIPDKWNWSLEGYFRVSPSLGRNSNGPALTPYAGGRFCALADVLVTARGGLAPDFPRRDCRRRRDTKR